MIETSEKPKKKEIGVLWFNPNASTKCVRGREEDLHGDYKCLKMQWTYCGGPDSLGHLINGLIRDGFKVVDTGRINASDQDAYIEFKKDIEYGLLARIGAPDMESTSEERSWGLYQE